MMNLLDMIAGYQQDNPQPSPVLPPEAYGAGGPEMMSQGAATTGAPPSVLDLLAQVKTPEVSLPQTNGRAALTPALLQFAQAVTAPRRRNQSTLNAVIGAANQGLGTYSKVRDATQDRANQQEILRRKLAESEMQMEQSRTAIARNKQLLYESEEDQKYKRETRPLEIERLHKTLAKATTDQEVANLQLRAAKIKDKYAEEEQQALIEERKARTAQARSAAAENAARAGLYKKQTEEFLAAIEARKKGPAPKVIEGDGLAGTPDRIQIGTQVYRLPMDDVAQATSWAKRQVDAMVALGEYKKDSPDYKSKLRELYAEARQGNVPKGALTQTTSPEQPKAPEAPVGGPGPSEKLKEAMRADPTGVFQEGGKLWVNGRTITPQEFASKGRKLGQPAPEEPTDNPQADRNAAIMAAQQQLETLQQHAAREPGFAAVLGPQIAELQAKILQLKGAR